MGRLKKIIALLVCTAFIMAFLAGPVLAKGARGGGFSSGGRSSFSSGAKGVSSPAKTYSTKSTSVSTGAKSAAPPTSGQVSGTSGAASSPAPAPAQVSQGGGANPYGKGFSTDTQSFSTPRQGSPPTLYSDYSTGTQGYSSGKGAYSTGMGSYNGTWNRESLAGGGLDKYPARPPVGVFGSPPQPPYQYHNAYWSLPWISRAFFQPNYYWTPWGYHYYAPRLLTWIVVIILVGAVVILIRNRFRVNRL